MCSMIWPWPLLPQASKPFFGMVKIPWHKWRIGTDAAPLSCCSGGPAQWQHLATAAAVSDFPNALLHVGLLLSGGPAHSVSDYIILSPWQPPVVKVVMTNLLANKVQRYNSTCWWQCCRPASWMVLYTTLMALWILHGERLDWKQSQTEGCTQEMMVIQHTLEYPQRWWNIDTIQMDLRSTLQALKNPFVRDNLLLKASILTRALSLCMGWFSSSDERNSMLKMMESNWS